MLLLYCLLLLLCCCSAVTADDVDVADVVAAVVAFRLVGVLPPLL